MDVRTGCMDTGNLVSNLVTRLLYCRWEYRWLSDPQQGKPKRVQPRLGYFNGWDMLDDRKLITKNLPSLKTTGVTKHLGWTKCFRMSKWWSFPPPVVITTSRSRNHIAQSNKGCIINWMGDQVKENIGWADQGCMSHKIITESA